MSLSLTAVDGFFFLAAALPDLPDLELFFAVSLPAFLAAGCSSCASAAPPPTSIAPASSATIDMAKIAPADFARIGSRSIRPPRASQLRVPRDTRAPAFSPARRLPARRARARLL